MKKFFNLNDTGDIKITEDVIAKISGIAAVDVEGVSDTQGNKAKEITNKVFKLYDKGVSVVTDENNYISINISIVVEYGFNVTKVSKKVQDNIKKSVENMTGFAVKEVNVNIVNVNVK